jgi:hypothetical protein
MKFWAPISAKIAPYLKNPLFKPPDLTGPLKAYDQELATYRAALKEREQLKALMEQFFNFNIDLNKKSEQALAEFVKLRAQSAPKAALSKMALLAEKVTLPIPPLVLPTIDEFISSVEELASNQKQLYDQIAAIDATRLAGAKKFREDFKAKSVAIDAVIKQVEGNVQKFESQIRSTIQTIQKIADKLDLTTVVAATKGFLGNF